MKKEILYKDREYSYKEYVELVNLSPTKLEGEVIIQETGEIIQADDEIAIRHHFINKLNELKDIDKVVNSKSNKEKMIERLTKKYKDKTVNRQEFALLLTITNNSRMDKITKQLLLTYEDYYSMNMNAPKPKGLSYLDYGRFVDMLNYCFNYKNELVYKNGKQIQKIDLKDFLEFESERSYYRFISNLKKYNMIAEIKINGKKFVMVNPYYANRNIKITREIFLYFEKDLSKCFDDLEIEYILSEDVGVFETSIVEIS